MRNLSVPVLAVVLTTLAAPAPASRAQEAHPPSAEETEASAAGTALYVVGSEDVLRIITWEEPDFTLVAKVRPDGRITMPLVNDIEVAGHTPAEVREIITASLRNLVREPRVTVIVEEINNFRVYFLGEINKQGPIQLYQPTRLLQAIATAGGLTEFADKRITILRSSNGGEIRIEVDYKKLLAGEPDQENLFLKPGDTILVR